MSLSPVEDPEVGLSSGEREGGNSEEAGMRGGVGKRTPLSRTEEPSAQQAAAPQGEERHRASAQQKHRTVYTDRGGSEQVPLLQISAPCIQQKARGRSTFWSQCSDVTRAGTPASSR